MDLDFYLVNAYVFTVVLVCHNGWLVFGSAPLLQPVSDYERLGDYNIYYSLNKTREILMKYYDTIDKIKMLVDEYDFRCSNNKVYYPKKFPFVTVEGAYRKTRHMIAQRLAKRIKGKVVGNPPQFMIMSNYVFNDTTELRRSFYSLGIHACACRVREILSNAPVIVAGYWIDQTSFGIAKMFDRIPPSSSCLYQWPEELMKPDRVYLINPVSNLPPIPLHPYKPMRVFTFKDKLIEAMMRFRSPSVTDINTTTNYNDIVNIIIHFMNKHFNSSYPVSF